jgi:hypothetical protein
MVNSVPMRISLVLAAHGLGRGDVAVSSLENVFVVLHPNNFPVTAPVLQASWWLPRYSSRFVTKSWVLGIVDLPSNSGPVTRTVSCWVRGLGRVWTGHGAAQSVILAGPHTNASDRVELSLIGVEAGSLALASLLE